MQDYPGGSFYHMLLAPMIAFILGIFASLIGKLLFISILNLKK